MAHVPRGGYTPDRNSGKADLAIDMLQLRIWMVRIVVKSVNFGSLSYNLISTHNAKLWPPRIGTLVLVWRSED